MPAEVLQLLQPERGGVFVDCTVGLGGHARLLLERGASRLIGLDRDATALALAAKALEPWRERVELVHADYRQLARVLTERGIERIDGGALADLGVSSLQLDAEGRGFSFRRDEALDMRMDRTQGETAADLLARVDEKELADVIYQFGEERDSRRIARALVNARANGPLVTTGQVADIVRRASRAKHGRIDPATRTFQALRIWVNRELEGLGEFLETAAERLSTSARLAVITFHSLEDRVVKHTFRRLAGAAADLPRDGFGLWRHERELSSVTPLVAVVTKRPVVPSDQEVTQNPRARSAKLRAVERV
jgi:16S rRNA (cytosine1402-N4)-methyltransferase